MTSERRSPDTPVRVGFLGAGLIATYHSKSLRRSGVPVVRAGVFDPDRQRAEAFAAASGHIICDTEAELLDTCDAVYVCTWTSEHERLVMEAITRGVHVFCEKPLAFNAVSAARMAAAADQAGIAHQVGLVLRYSPAFRLAHRLVHDESAGRVMAVVLRDDQFIPVQGHYDSTWRGDRQRAGAGTLLEHSIHDVDMLHYLVGPVTSTSAHTSSFHGIDGIEDVATAVLQFESGATGTLCSVWHDNMSRPSLRRLEVFCERRHVVIDGDDWFGPVSWTDTGGERESLEGAALVDAVGGEINPDGMFIDAIHHSRSAFPSLHVAVAAHRVVDAIYTSAANHGSPVTP